MMDVSLLAIARMLLVLLPMLFIGTALLTFIAAGTKSVKEAQSYMSMLMLLPIVPTVILMVSPIRTQLWQYTVPFLAQNQMLLKVIRSETIAPLEWAVYFGAGFGLAALLCSRRRGATTRSGWRSRPEGSPALARAASAASSCLGPSPCDGRGRLGGGGHGSR